MEDTIDIESISTLFPSTVIVGVPSIVESERLPPIDVAALSLSELTLTPESALQLPRSPGSSPRPCVVVGNPPEPGVTAPPFMLCLGMDATDSWSDMQPLVTSCLRT